MRILSLGVIFFLMVSVKIMPWEKVLFLGKAQASSVKSEKCETKRGSKHINPLSYLKVYVDRALMPVSSFFRPNQSVKKNYEYLSLVRDELVFQKFSDDNIVKEIFEDFDFDLDFGYSGIKKTKTEMPLELSYEGIEEAILTGFEAKETLVSYYEVFPSISLLAHVSLHERYTSEKLEGRQEELRDVAREIPLNTFEQKYLQSVKYGLGLRWKKKFLRKTELVLDAFWLQKSDNHWQIENLSLKEHEYLGSSFDSWKLSISLLF